MEGGATLEQRGIIPNTLDYLFGRINQASECWDDVTAQHIHVNLTTLLLWPVAAAHTLFGDVGTGVTSEV